MRLRINPSVDKKVPFFMAILDPYLKYISRWRYTSQCVTSQARDSWVSNVTFYIQYVLQSIMINWLQPCPADDMMIGCKFCLFFLDFITTQLPTKVISHVEKKIPNQNVTSTTDATHSHHWSHEVTILDQVRLSPSHLYDI